MGGFEMDPTRASCQPSCPEPPFALQLSNTSVAGAAAEAAMFQNACCMQYSLSHVMARRALPRRL